MTLLTKYAAVVGVAVLYVALALANGGYSHELIAGATVAIWWAVVIALAFGRFPRSRVPSAALVAGACLAAFAAWTALSIVWASDNGGAFVEVARVLGYLGLFALVVIVSPRASARSWLAGLALGLVVVAGLALLSRFEPSFGGDKELARFLPDATGRLSYPIGYWNGLAAAMALGAVLLAWLGGHARAAATRALAVAAIPLPVLVVYLASSRGGVAAAAVGLAVLLGLGPARARMAAGLALGGAGGALLVVVASRKHELVDGVGNATAAHQGDQMLAITIGVVVAVGVLRLLADRPLLAIEVPRRMTQAVGVGVVVAVVVAVAVAGPAKRWDEFKRVAPQEAKTGYVAQHLTSGSGSGRYQYWSAALDAFEDHPIHGIGAGGYEAFWDQHGSLPRTIRDAHSLFIETMAELGLVGLVLILGFLGVPAVTGVKRGAGQGGGVELSVALAVLAAGIASAALDWTWELPACFGPVVLAAGLLTGPATLGLAGAPSENAAAGATPAQPARFGLGIATLVLGWMAIWVAGVVFLTEVRVGDSQAAVRAGDLPAAAQDARDAITVQPWAAEPRLQLALVEEQAGDLTTADRDIGEAIDRAPDDWELWFVRARLEVKLGDVPAAERSLERARALNPRSPFLAQ